MKNLKIVLVAIVAVLTLVVVLQNTAQVETRLLFVTVTMPRAILLAVTLLIGFVIGLLLGPRLSKKVRDSGE